MGCSPSVPISPTIAEKGTRKSDSWKCLECSSCIIKGNGYGNLGVHIRRCRIDTIDDDLQDSQLRTRRHFISKREGRDRLQVDFVHSRLPQPIDIVNQACYRKLVEQHNLNDQKDFICSNTLLKFIILLCEHVVDAITLKLRESFGIALDGWTENLMHIVAIFAICTESNCLLAICKMVLEVRNDKSDTCGWKTSSFKIQKNWKLQIYC